MPLGSVNKTLVNQNMSWTGRENLLGYDKTGSWARVRVETIVDIPIARDELIASPRPMYLSSIIGLMRPAHKTRRKGGGEGREDRRVEA